MATNLSKTILLVEDDEILSIVNSEFLMNYGYTVVTANTGKKAISLIQENENINLVLMDIDLGDDDMDGIEVTELILANRDIPLLFLSNHTEGEVLQKIEIINSYGYIPKHSGITIIDTSIKMALKLFQEKKRAKESEAHYRILFEQASEAIFIVNANGQYTDANPAACILLGYTKEELLELSITEIIPNEDLAVHLLQLEELRFKGRLTCTCSLLRKDGAMLVVETNALVRPDHSFQVTIRDITEQNNREQIIKAFHKKLERAHVDLLQRQFAIDQHAIVAITNLAGTIIYVNEKFCEISGYSTDELIGQNHRIVNSNYHSSDFFKGMYSTLKQGLAWHGEIRNRAKNGSYYWVATTIAPIKNGNGKIEQYFAIRTDITNRKQAEQELESHQIELEAQNLELKRVQAEMVAAKLKYFELYDLAPVGYFTVNEKGMILEANFTLASMLNVNRGALLDLSIFQFICNQDQDIFYYLQQELYRNNKVQSSELRMKKADGKEFWVRLDAVPSSEEDGTLVSRVAVTNISKRKEVEKELHHYMKVLEDTNKTKDKFFSIIAHDLRNPFSGIMGISDLLETKLLETECENSQLLLRYTQLIQSSSKSAFTLLENLLLWARSQTGEIKIIARPIDLNQLISYTIPIVLGNAFKKNITIETELADTHTVNADDFSISTILRNLLTNAIKFTHSYGKIVVSTAMKENFLEVSITDTGVGIDPKNLESLFRIDSKFSKSGTDNEKGTGLGLILCKEFVEKQGGQIWAESEFGKGSKFSFTLPLVTQV